MIKHSLFSPRFSGQMLCLRSKKSLENKDVRNRNGNVCGGYLLELLRSEFKDGRDGQLRCFVVMHHERYVE